MTPEATSSPNALPPERTTAFTCSTLLTGSSSANSLVPGALPRTSTPPVAPSLAIMTVHPVARSLSVWCPSSSPLTAVSPQGSIAGFS